ncbi:MAG: hypothetical protein GF344_07315 [Chitinivibrionales bacterium]|nr:hypothetical protein [Chitinivibrionales bacterium]MBD3356718.1 hypothetical protein [Chitinivibrionales bacterium]
MKKVRVENFEKGMILARDVCGTSGSVLLGNGTPLSAALGRRLKNWGIDFVYVEGEEETEEHTTAADATPKEIKAHLEKKFSRVIDNPIMQQIFTAVYQYRIRKGLR